MNILPLSLDSGPFLLVSSSDYGPKTKTFTTILCFSRLDSNATKISSFHCCHGNQHPNYCLKIRKVTSAATKKERNGCPLWRLRRTPTHKNQWGSISALLAQMCSCKQKALTSLSSTLHAEHSWKTLLLFKLTFATLEAGSVADVLVMTTSWTA